MLNGLYTKEVKKLPQQRSWLSFLSVIHLVSPLGDASILYGNPLIHRGLIIVRIMELLIMP